MRACFSAFCISWKSKKLLYGENSGTVYETVGTWQTLEQKIYLGFCRWLDVVVVLSLFQ